MSVDPSPLPPNFAQLAADAAKADCFGPPEEPCLCGCMHCNRQFMSDQMWFQAALEKGGKVDGFWMCPTPNCGGAGFCFDIFPLDPDHPANAGWHYSDDDEGSEEDEWDEEAEASAKTDEPYDPAEPEYVEEEDEDIEGDEWKQGVPPAEAFGESVDSASGAENPFEAEARRQWEAEQKKYDMPDERPRWLDRTNEPDRPDINVDDIPF